MQDGWLVSGMRPLAVLAALVTGAVFCACGVPVQTGAPEVVSAPLGSAFGPGARVLLDAHNAYPERGRWADRIDRALATGVPLAIEQDLYWRRDAERKHHEVVVAHDSDALVGAPTLETHFFETIRPIMERALREDHRASWPLVTLNLDFKTNEPALHEAVWTLLGKYEQWLTTATRTANPDMRSPLSVGPLLVLSGADAGQRARFHDQVPVGARLRAFGAAPVPTPQGSTREARARDQVRTAPHALMPRPASNYLRWVNFSWLVVEEGGAAKAAAWTAGDSVRLASVVRRAHSQHYWIRLYTLDAFGANDDRGYTASYNFGSELAAALRWRAVIAAGVDFVATDQYEAFQAHRK